MPVDLFGAETTASATGRVYCDPDGYPHISTAGLYLCPNCRHYHHLDGYSRRVECPHPPAPPRRWDDPAEDELAEPCQECPPATYHDDPADCPEAVTDCATCETKHRTREDCPREFCDDCDDYHDRDQWGQIECPGWYCEDCDDYHDYGDGCPRPSYDGCCNAPRQQFTIRNDGKPPLASDTRAPVTLPAGVISDEGLREIQRYLLRMARASDQRGLGELVYEIQDALGSQWQTKTGNYTKRLSRYAYQQHQVKITPEVLSQVGCIASDHSKAVSFDVDVTRNLNRPPGDFYHDESCWWQSYSESRCALKTNGGFGLRSFGQYGNVSGRAWVMPLHKNADGYLVPTFDTMTPDAFVVFNGYGDLGGYTGARIMAHMSGWTYAKIGFECDPMYINAGGYLIAPEQTVQTCKSLDLNVRQHADLNERELANAA